MANLVFNVKGLTAADRQQWEKDNIKELTELDYFRNSEEDRDRYFRNTSFRNKYKHRSDYDLLRELPDSTTDLLFELDMKDDESFEDVIKRNNAYMGYLLRGKKWKKTGDLMVKDFDETASKVSKYYRYLGSENLPWDEDRRIEEAARYKANVDLVGEDAANEILYDRIKGEVSKNLSMIDKIAGGFVGAGAGIVGGSLQFIAMLESYPWYLAEVAYERIKGEGKDMGFLADILSRASSNALARFGLRIIQSNSFIKAADPNWNPETDLLEWEIVTDPEDEKAGLWQSIFNRNFVPRLIEQSGPTAASIIQGRASSAVVSGAFSALKGSSMVARNTAMLTKLATMERRALAYGVPFTVGAAEGFQNAAETRQSIIDDLTLQHRLLQFNKIEAEVDKQLENIEIPDDIKISGQELLFRNQLKQSMMAEKMAKINPDELDIMKIDELASESALVDFMVTTTVNGTLGTLFLNLKYGKRVRESFKRSRVGRYFSDDLFTIGKDNKVAANTIGYGKMAVNAAKEFGSEGVEEGTLNISSDAVSAVAEYRFDDYLRHKYLGEAEKGLVETITDGMGVAFDAIKESATSRETIEAGIWGALGSAAGTPEAGFFNPSNYRNIANAKGVRGKATAIMDMLYRNPIIESVRNDLQENKDREAAAKSLNEWLDRDKNREKYLSIKGVAEWAKEFNEKIDEGDEYEIRNKRLGMLVSDYFMMQKIKGTSLYESHMKLLMNILNAEEGSELAKLIELTTGLSLLEVKNDVQLMLDTMDKVQQEADNLEKVLGNSISEETKESFIFNKIRIEDNKERQALLEEEISGLKMSTTSLTVDKQDEYVARHGNAKFSEDKRIVKLESDIDNLLKNERLLTKELKEELSLKKKALAKLKKEEDKRRLEHLKLFSEQEIEDGYVLSKESILNLDPISRAIILNPKNLGKYSPKLLLVIQELIREKTLDDPNFLNKVEDSGRIFHATESYIQQYTEALKSPEFLSRLSTELRFEREINNRIKSYEYLNSITDPRAFSKELNDILETEDPITHLAISLVLKDNPLYKEYTTVTENIGKIASILAGSEDFGGFSDTARAQTLMALRYLQKYGMDPTSIEALLFLAEDGGLGLQKFIDEFNEKSLLAGEATVLYDSIDQVIDSFLKSLDIVKRDLEEREKANAKDVRPQTETPTGTPVVLDKTLDEPLDKTLNKPTEEKDKKEDKNKGPLPIIDKILEDLLSLTDLYSRDPSSMSPDEFTTYKRLRNNLVFAEMHLASESEILDYLNLERESDQYTLEQREYLNKVIDKYIKNLEDELNKLKEGLKEGQKEGLEDKGQPKNSESKLDAGQTPADSVRKSAVVTLIDGNQEGLSLEITNFYTAYGIDRFLRETVIPSNVTIHILYVPTLDGGRLVAAVDPRELKPHNESMPSLGLQIEAGGVKYLPIGVIPSGLMDTLIDKVDRASNLSLHLAATRVNGLIEKERPLYIPKDLPNKNIRNAALEEVDKQSLNKVDPNRLMEEIFKHIYYVTKVSSKGEEYRLLVYRPNGKKTTEDLEIGIYIPDPEKTSNSLGKNWGEVLRGDNELSILSFNSRIGDGLGGNYGFIPALNSFMNRFNPNEDIKQLSSDLNDSLLKYLKLPKSYYYTLVETGVTNIEGTNYKTFNLVVAQLGKADLIVIASITGKSLSNPVLILRSLFLDEKGNFRQVPYKDGTTPLVKWNVDYNNFDSENSHYNDSAAKAHRMDIYNDGLLTISQTRLTTAVKLILIHNPVTAKEALPTNKSVANQDNAKPIDDPKVPDPQEHLGPSPDKTEVNTRAKVEEIKSASKEIIRKHDGSYESGRGRSTGVTSLIRETEKSNNPEAFAMGNSLDSLMRRLFAGATDVKGVPNVADEDVKTLLELVALRIRSELQGYEFVSEILYSDGDVDGVRVNGALQVTAIDGSVFDVPITGTLDLLAYNPKTGKYRIYDFKTVKNRSLIKENEDKWKLQLYLYKKMMEDRYGISIESVHVLPIEVTYPEGLLVDEKTNLLYAQNGDNRILYKGASPRLLETLTYEDVTNGKFKFRVDIKNLSKEDLARYRGEIPNGEPKSASVKPTESKPISPSNGELNAPPIGGSSMMLGELGFEEDDYVLPIGSGLSTSSNSWDKLDEETKNTLAKERGMNLETWDSLPEELKKKNLDCIKNS